MGKFLVNMQANGSDYIEDRDQQFLVDTKKPGVLAQGRHGILQPVDVAPWLSWPMFYSERGRLVELC